MSAEVVPTATPADGRVAIARQAIHDRSTRVVGYALLLRDAAAGDDDERDATQVIVETFTAIGVAAIAGERPAHVRVPRRFLLEQHALALPPERVVLEVADPGGEDEPLDAVLERLAEQGYRISLVCDPRRPLPRERARTAASVKLDVAGLADDELDECVERHGRAA
ncbi:MAG TPA: hypothetical protein VFV85_09350, partial [Conexibacter sp.]|nr:hypothetical protein [Conexibacter sp.]